MTVVSKIVSLFNIKPNEEREFRTAGYLHYPTGICAGRVPAQTIVREMKANSDFQRDFAEAKAEIAAAQTAKNSN